MKKKAIVELSSKQDKTVLRLAAERKTYKVEIIRKLIDLLDGLSGDIQIVAYDKKNLNIMDNFKSIQVLHNEENVHDFNLDCRYLKGRGVQSNSHCTILEVFGGVDDDVYNEEIAKIAGI